MKTLYMLIGVPGSGKSTWINSQSFDKDTTVILSTDNHIEKIASRQNKTYSEVFKDAFDEANANMNLDLAHAIKNGYDIVWDQTNLNPKSRKNKLRSVPRYYKKIAVVFKIPEPTELRRRLDSRHGKNISPELSDIMISQFAMPTSQEGFDQIIVA